MPNPIPERFRRVLLAVCELYLGAPARGISQESDRNAKLHEALRPLGVSYQDLLSERKLYRVRESAPEPNKPHSQWLQIMDTVTRRWAHDIYDSGAHFNPSIFTAVNETRLSVGLPAISEQDV